MKTLMTLAVMVLTMLLVPASVPAQTRQGVVTVAVDLSGQEAGQETRLWLPYPVSDADQLISQISVSGDFAESAVYTDRTYGTPMLYVRWDATARSRKMTLTFAAEREEVRRDLSANEDAWSPADYRQYLAPTSLGPVDGEVKKRADSITRGRKGVLEKARAIYDWTCDNMSRDPDVRGCGKGDVCQLLDTRRGKCTDISSVFVALCRAAGVPAREVFGIRLGKKDRDDVTTWQHCWAEIFVPGNGWIPADPADVRKAILEEKLKPDEPKARQYREYFWGGIDANRLKLAIGRDIVLNPPQSGPPLNSFGYPYAEIGGKSIDWYDPKRFSYSINFRQR